ncbi:unnamed protein product [Pylaiella littoralis]
MWTRDTFSRPCFNGNVLKAVVYPISGRVFMTHCLKTSCDVTLEVMMRGYHVLGDFLAEVATLVLFSAPTRATLFNTRRSTALPRGKPDSGRSSNGGFACRTARAFQETLWYSVYEFMTGPHSVAHDVGSLHPSLYPNSNIVRFVAPYANAEDGREEDRGASATGGGRRWQRQRQ